MPVGAAFFAHVQTGHGPTQPYPQCVPRVKRPGVALTTHPHLVRKLKTEYSYTSIPPLCLRGNLQS